MPVPFCPSAPGAGLYYWMGVTRQPNPDLMTSNVAAGKPWFTLPGTELSDWAPSNGPEQGPMYAPYAHWGPQEWVQNRHFAYGGGGVGDCVLSDVYYGQYTWYTGCPFIHPSGCATNVSSYKNWNHGAWSDLTVTPPAPTSAVLGVPWSWVSWRCGDALQSICEWVAACPRAACD